MTPEHAVPEGLFCPTCGYEVSGLMLGSPCPECGMRLGDQELGHAEARRRLLLEGPRMLRRRLAFWGLIVPMVSGGAVLFASWAEAWSIGLNALVTTSSLVGASVLLGGLAAVLGPPHEREVRWLLWIRSLHWIHGPWLVIPGFAVLALCVAGIDAAFSSSRAPGGDSMFVLAAVGLPLWFGGCLWGLGRWSASWSPTYGLKPWPTLVGAVFMFALWVASVLVGLAGGLLAASGAVRMLG